VTTRFTAKEVARAAVFVAPKRASPDGRERDDHQHDYDHRNTRDNDDSAPEIHAPSISAEGFRGADGALTCN
jgi:hypothetical protein